MTEDAPQRVHGLRRIFDAMRWIVRSGAPWRYMPGDFPPWEAVYQQARRWIEAGVFERMVQDLRETLRLAEGRQAQPTAVIVDGRTLRSSRESGPRAGYDGAKKTRGSKVHAAVDTLGNLLALTVTPADVGERTQVAALAKAVQEATGDTVEVMYADQGYTGPDPKAAAEAEGIELTVVRLPGAKKGFVLLPKRWVVERTFAWMARFRRLSRDYERLPKVLAGLHFLVVSMLMLAKVKLIPKSS